MADGILKSNPDGIWEYYLSLNKNMGYLDDAMKDAERTFGSLKERMDKKQSFLQEKLDALEKELHILIERLNQAKNGKEETELQVEIASVEKSIQGLQEKYTELMRMKRQMPEYFDAITYELNRCKEAFARGKRILNAYLKMVEVEQAKGEFQEYNHSMTSGKFGTMEYRGNIFYCNNGAFEVNSENMARMERGKAPLGHDGQSVELHHIEQTNKGGIMEVEASQHRKGHKVLHINSGDMPSGIDRSGFNVLKAAYWKRRAEILKSGGMF